MLFKIIKLFKVFILFPHSPFFDFRGADFAMNAVRPGWAVLDVLPIRGGQGRAKYAL